MDTISSPPVETPIREVRLSDAQRVAMSRACQRDDLMIAQPAKLTGQAAATFVAAMVRNGFAGRTDFAAGKPFWDCGRRAEDDIELEHRFSLVLTSKGLEAIGVSLDPAEPALGAPTQSEDAAVIETSGADEKRSINAPTVLRNRVRVKGKSSKKDQIILALKAKDGATVAELMKMTTWQAHTVRAALTRLRQEGFELIREKGTDQPESRYRIHLADNSSGSVATGGAAQSLDDNSAHQTRIGDAS